MRSALNPSMTLTHYLEQRTFSPGDRVSGFLKVEVTKEIEITRIAVHLVGGEHTQIQSGKHTYHSDFEFYSQHITLFGQTRAGGESGKAFLSPGTYTYNFDAVLPFNIPPSGKLQYVGDYAKVKYTLEGRVVVPLWVDMTTEETIQVFSTAPLTQFMRAVSEALPLGRFECGEHRCGCNSALTSSSDCCYCQPKADSQVRVSIDVYPSVLLVGDVLASGYPVPLPIVRDPVIALAPDANTLTVRLSIENQLAVPLHKVEVVLFQRISWSASSNSETHMVELGRTCYNCLSNSSVEPINAGHSVIFDATIPVATNPVPSMKTKYIDSTTFLFVRFPEYKIPDVRLGGNIILANTASMSDDIPTLPGTFTQKQTLPEIVV